jgi:hypothetical protein
MMILVANNMRGENSESGRMLRPLMSGMEEVLRPWEVSGM